MAENRNMTLTLGSLSTDEATEIVDLVASWRASTVDVGVTGTVKPKTVKSAKVEEETIEDEYPTGDTDSDVDDFSSDDSEAVDDDSDVGDEKVEAPLKKVAKAPVDDGKKVIKAFTTYFEENGARAAKAVLKKLGIAKISQVKATDYKKALKLLAA